MSKASDSAERPSQTFPVEAEDAGQRLDVFLTASLADASRALVRRSIDAKLCQVNGKQEKPSYRLSTGDEVSCRLAAPPAEGPAPEPIDLDVLFEDDSLIAVNKPPGMVVHPAKGHWSGTLASALVHRFKQLSTIGGPTRPGIVHRLDRDTSGAIVVAKSDMAHRAIAAQFQNRTVQKEYFAIVTGRPDRDRDRIDHPIGPHPSKREKMALRADHQESRSAETFYEVVERYPGFSCIRAMPKTGRTHQIRLHMLHAGHPILCDKLYGGRSQLTAGELRALVRVKHAASDLPDDAVLLDRQALHARRLQIAHPVTGAVLDFEAPLPADLANLQDILRGLAAAR